MAAKKTTIAHTQPGLSRPVVISVTINISLDRPFWFAFAVLWLAWAALVRVGKFLNRLYEIGRAVVVVAWRRMRRVLRDGTRRIEWTFNGLAYGPVLGVG